ncbi:ryncolin-2-like [Mizuhopecten yessoensis]|uniref:Microfibril-associated glycoprotein 4 n=1 Tax=Mizuhopecten yessoensis TaxID=6573 RepID=A0A210Q762_MIZYE|nr:ryncolin-2-like [Mizuhopecten yessoensis]OWF44561.1 Microfibril-associated glycoprotein 4 [Mizuhopecten yessoensis]
MSYQKNEAGTTNNTAGYTLEDVMDSTPTRLTCASVCSIQDCDENAGSQSAVYTLAIPPVTVFYAYCDMETLNGGWLVIQNRFDGSQEFFNFWIEFKTGFGDPSGEYWLGNEKMYLLTSAQTYELYIEMEDVDGDTRYVRYSSFALSSESNGYRLSVSGFSGNVTDSMAYNNGQRFTTKDRDQDMRPSANCANVFRGSWWYRSCHHSNLNGFYDPVPGDNPKTMCWKNFTGTVKFTSLRKFRMLIRPVTWCTKSR